MAYKQNVPRTVCFASVSPKDVTDWSALPRLVDHFAGQKLRVLCAFRLFPSQTVHVWNDYSYMIGS